MLLRLQGAISGSAVAEVLDLVGGGEFVSGLSTARGSAAGVKNNLQLEAATAPAEKAAATLLGHLRANPVFELAVMPVRIEGPRFSLYEPGMNYGDHLDAAVMGTETRVRADVAVTVFLSDPASYDGGELVIDSPYGVEQVKGDVGDCVVYPASTVHRVDPVTRGRRLAAVMWIQSAVRDPAKRQILYDLGSVLEFLDQTTELGAPVERLRHCHVNLTRMWSDV